MLFIKTETVIKLYILCRFKWYTIRSRARVCRVPWL